MSRTAPGTDLPVALDRSDPRPLSTQVADAVRAAVVTGTLAPGDRLPSSRALAAQLTTARGTVVAAYEQLDGEGYLRSASGSGTRVADGLVLPVRPAPSRGTVGGPAAGAGTVAEGRPPARAPSPSPRSSTWPGHAAGGSVDLVDLVPGRPGTGGLGGPAWRSAWRSVATAPVPDGEVDPAGEAVLREQVVAHLRQVRGLVTTLEEVVVTSGARHGLAGVVAALTVLRGRPLVVAVEDPGWPAAPRVLARAGSRALPVPVDGAGLDVAALAAAAGSAGGVDAVLLTPSHQYPLGGAMALHRRLDLLSWAAAHDAVVLEDDYDSEFRHVGPPLPTLSSLAAGGAPTVVHLGTFSKSLSPWLRAGWLVATDPALRGEVLAARRDLGDGPGGPVQRALAALMTSGELRRHTARARRDHRHRRAVLLREVAAAPHLAVRAVDGGLHAVVELPSGTSGAAVVAAAAERGLAVADLADYRVPGSRLVLAPAVVIGDGGASTGQVRSAVRLLADLTAPGAPAPGPPAAEATTAGPRATAAPGPATAGPRPAAAGTGDRARSVAQASASRRTAAARAAATAPVPGASVASTVAPS